MTVHQSCIWLHSAFAGARLTLPDVSRLSRKLGFGFRPEEEIPSDFVAWATAQLTAKPRQLGIAATRYLYLRAATPPAIVEWPTERLWSLPDQVKHALALRTGKEALDKKYDNSSEEYRQKRRALEQEHDPQSWDIIRRAHQAIYGEAPVLERFAHFWSNHFTTALKDAVATVMGHYLDVAIRDNLGSDFATMLYDVTTHPGMQNYLDNDYSMGPNSREGKKRRASGQFADINENLARELLELHTVSPSAAYTQDDIINAAEILTGWGYIIDLPKQVPGKEYWKVFFKDRHEPGDKLVLGQTFKPGMDALKQLTDSLASNEHTIQHLATKLARYFLTDVPDEADIAAIADAWRSSNGNLPAVHQRVIEIAAARPELRKFQQPEVWLYQMLRTTGADLFLGFEQISVLDRRGNADEFDRGGEILRELGQTYWIERQPNGYSDQMADWVSTEYMDRRLRFSSFVKAAGFPRLTVEQLTDRLALSDTALSLIAKGKDDAEKFMLLFCGPDMMEA